MFQEKIQDLNRRANGLWLPKKEISDDVIVVCLYVNDRGKFVQAWFSHWDVEKAISRPFDKYVAERPNIEAALSDLDCYLCDAEAEREFCLAEAEDIINEIGFGD